MTPKATLALADEILARKAAPLYPTYSMTQLWNMDPAELNEDALLGFGPYDGIPVDGDALARKAAELDLAEQIARRL